jgi:hypothetical protein
MATNEGSGPDFQPCFAGETAILQTSAHHQVAKSGHELSKI